MMPLFTSKFQDHEASPWVKLFALVASTCKKMPLIYHPIRLRMGSKGCLKQVILPEVIPWAHGTSLNSINVVLMQDSNLCHTNKMA